jgi:DNA polymerase I-like protein with 3'-5' exonuclease and polymerase domains
MFGVLVEHGKRRWIATPGLECYGVGKKAHMDQGAVLGHLYRHLELLRIGLPGWDDPAEPVKTRIVTDEASWLELKGLLSRARVVAIDSETRDLRRIGNVLLTLQFGFDGRTGWVLPVSHPGSQLGPRLLREIFSFLKEYFESGKPVVTIFANAVFDLHQLIDKLGLRWYNHRIWDVQAGNFNLEENAMFRHLLGMKKGEFFSLERLCIEAGMHHYDRGTLKKSDRNRLEALPIKDVAEYGALDVTLPIRLMRMQRALARYRNSRHAHHPYAMFDQAVMEVEGPKLQQFAFVERNGLKVDTDYVVSMQGPHSPFLKEIRESEDRFMALPEVQEASRIILGKKNVRSGGGLFGRKAAVPRAFDPGKSAHQQILFFDVCKLPVLSERQDGGGSIDKEFKARFKDHPVVAGFADLEEAKKLNGTFIAGYYKILRTEPDNRDGRLRTKFSYIIVITGRTSSSNPNLQNVPERKSRAKIVKRQFISEEGRLLCKSDFSAHEVRVWGAASNDPAIAKTFWTGMQVRLKYEYLRTISEKDVEGWKLKLKLSDVHYQNYGLLYTVDPATVTKPQRDGVKTVIFKSLYGTGMDSLAKDLKSTVPEAKKIWNMIFRDTFKVGGDWLDQCHRLGRKTCLVPNILGGVRHLYGYLHPEKHIQSAMDRRSPNSAVQGPSSNLGLRAAMFVREMVWKWFVSKGVDLDYIQCNMVHDSTTAESSIVNIPLAEYLRLHGFTTRLHQWMRDVMGHPLKVGFETDAKIGACDAYLKDASRTELMVEAIQAGIEWGNANLGWKQDVAALMPIVRHNAKIIHDIRRREIEHQMRGRHAVNYHMLMNEDNALKWGLIFEVPKKMKSAAANERLVRELEGV